MILYLSLSNLSTFIRLNILSFPMGEPPIDVDRYSFVQHISFQLVHIPHLVTGVVYFSFVFLVSFLMENFFDVSSISFCFLLSYPSSFAYILGFIFGVHIGCIGAGINIYYLGVCCLFFS